MPTAPLTGASSPTEAPGLPVPLTRAREGRWLAGVCAGLARHRNLPLRPVRIVFGLSALVGGVGVLAYLACWLIIPADTDDETGAAGTRGIVVLAQGCAACVGLATLAAVGAAATIFGFGWVVLAIAAVVLLAALVTWPRAGAGWTLLPIAALVLPGLAMAVGGVQVDPETRDVAVAPRSVGDIPRAGYGSGLGALLVDLRRTTFPATGNLSVRIDAGIRRTIIALPTSRCVRVDLRYDVVPFAGRVASILSGRDAPFSGVTLFGVLQSSRAGEDGNVPGPAAASRTLTVDFHSAGGSLYVRDYADSVDPQIEPDWPGYPVTLEPRPDITGTPPAAAKRLIDGWLLRRRVQSASAARVNRLLPGPCGATVGQPTPARPAGVAYPIPPPYPVVPVGKPYTPGPNGGAYPVPVGKASAPGPNGQTYPVPVGKPYAGGPNGQAYPLPAGKAPLAAPTGGSAQGGGYKGGAFGGGASAGAVPVAPTPPTPPAVPSTGQAGTSPAGVTTKTTPTPVATTRRTASGSTLRRPKSAGAGRHSTATTHHPATATHHPATATHHPATATHHPATATRHSAAVSRHSTTTGSRP